MGESRVDFDEVRRNCAEPGVVCMLVSRFLKIPIQMNLSEKDSSHSKRLCLVLGPSGVGGYMRKRRFQKLKSNWSLRFLSLWGLAWAHIPGIPNWPTPRNRCYRLEMGETA